MNKIRAKAAAIVAGYFMLAAITVCGVVYLIYTLSRPYDLIAGFFVFGVGLFIFWYFTLLEEDVIKLTKR